MTLHARTLTPELLTYELTLRFSCSRAAGTCRNPPHQHRHHDSLLGGQHSLLWNECVPIHRSQPVIRAAVQLGSTDRRRRAGLLPGAAAGLRVNQCAAAGPGPRLAAADHPPGTESTRAGPRPADCLPGALPRHLLARALVR